MHRVAQKVEIGLFKKDTSCVYIFTTHTHVYMYVGLSRFIGSLCPLCMGAIHKPCVFKVRGQLLYHPSSCQYHYYPASI